MPIVTHDNNILYIYSNILIKDLQVTIKDSYDNLIHSEITSLYVDKTITILLNNLTAGEYKIELVSENESLFGYFFIE